MLDNAITEEEFKQIVCSLEKYSTHPIANVHRRALENKK